MMFSVVLLLLISQSFAAVKYTGVNLAGLEFGEGAKPGVANRDYGIPTNAEVDYFVGKGMNVIRLPFLWERLQPTGKGAFNSEYLGYIDNFVTYTTKTKRTTVVLDPHNYARYYDVLVSQKGPEFVDLWIRLANLYKNNSLVIFGLMNEPYDMLTSDWLFAANLAIAGIRQTGATNLILVPGNAWTGAHSWLQNWYDTNGKSNADVMINVVDPGNNYAYEIHQYFDYNYGGTSDSCLSATIGTEVMASFTTWARQNNKKAFLGEFAGGRNQLCYNCIFNTLAYLRDNSDVYIGWTWWSGGPMWGNYVFALDPTGSTDAPQMQYLLPYLSGSSGGPPPGTDAPPPPPPPGSSTPAPTRRTPTLAPGTPAPTRRTATIAPTSSSNTPAPTRRTQTTPPTSTTCDGVAIFKDGKFQNSFQGYYSWGTYSLSDSSVKYAGSNTLSKVMKGWEGLQLRCAESRMNCLSINNVDTISFYVYTTAPQSFSFLVKILIGSNTEFRTNYYATAYPSVWTRVSIPLAYFQGISSFNGIQFQDTGNPSYKTYFGDVIMQKTCLGAGSSAIFEPTPEPTPEPTTEPTTAPDDTDAPTGCNSNSNTAICPLFTTPTISEATLVSVNHQGGECSYSSLPSFADGSMTRIRINTDGLGSSAQTIKCGMCVQISGSGSNSLNSTIIGFVTDLCSACSPGGMNIDSSDIQTSVGISWNAIDCPVVSALQYQFQKSSANYIKLQIRNHKVPIDYVEFGNSDGSYVRSARSSDNFFVPSGISYPVSMPIQLRITGITGEVITDSISQIDNNGILSGSFGAQFSGTGVAQ